MVLDNPVWTSLTGAHAPLAIGDGVARRYPAEVGVFAAVEAPTKLALDALAEIVAPGEVVGLFALDAQRVAGPWTVAAEMELIQMVGEIDLTPPEAPVVELASTDTEKMLALAQVTQPGPFGLRTIEMGRYAGRWEGDKLAAMAGERLKPTGYTEVSAVCTDPAFRGQGHAQVLVRAIGAQIQQRGETPFLHVAAGSASESTAVGVYERLGFRQRVRCSLTILQRS